MSRVVHLIGETRFFIAKQTHNNALTGIESQSKAAIASAINGRAGPPLGSTKQADLLREPRSRERVSVAYNTPLALQKCSGY